MRGQAGSVAALALVILGSAPAAAQEAASGATLPPVGCIVSVGIATGEKGEVDARFRGLPRRFGSVRLWKEQAWKLQFGEWGRMVLPTGTELAVVPVNVRGQTLNMKFDLPGVVSTKLRLQNQRALVVGPLPHEDGYLVIRVMPEFTDYLVAEPPSGAGAPPESVPVNGGR